MGAVLDDFGFADFEEARGGFGFGAGACSTWVTNGGGAVLMMRHGPEHVGKFLFVARLHEDDAGDVTEVADIEEAVVGGSVVTAETGAIHAEGHVKVLQCDVVNDHVVGPLHERRIDGEKGGETLGGEAAGKKGGVFLGDADIVEAIWMFLGKMDETGAGGHGGGDADDFVVGIGKFGEGLPEDFGIGGRGGGDGFAAVDGVFAEAVEFIGFGDGGSVAFAFLGEDVKNDGFVLGF